MKKVLRSLLRIAAGVALVVIAAWIYVAQPTWTRRARATAVVDPERLKVHVATICGFSPRTHLRVDQLDATANYIAGQFQAAGAEPAFQEFRIGRRTYRNVIARWGTGAGKRLIVGAHYDSCADTPGADDNASGVAALIELAHLFRKAAPKRDVELVAYTLEEPPFFGSEKMGSFFHAQSVAREAREVTGVIVLEMVGYFQDEPFSGIDAVMITDTAFTRNPNYHETTDTPETLDYARLAAAVTAVYAATL